MPDIKIICCDIDGTLVRDDKSLSDENRLWISKAVNERNVKFVIVSGRILSALKFFNKTLGLTGLCSCLNGTFLSDEDDKILANHTLSYEDAQRIVDIHEQTGIEVLSVVENSWYTENINGYLAENKTKMYLQPAIASKQRDVINTKQVNKFVFVSKSQEEIDLVYDRINSQVRPGQLTLYKSMGFVEVMPGGISKGTAVDDLINYYKVDRSQVMALGDDINDVEMIQKAGLGVAMGNALDCVKQVANAVTDTNQNDGVAKAIQKYIFSIEKY